jgi:hypothetical protein
VKEKRKGPGPSRILWQGEKKGRGKDNGEVYTAAVELD